MVKERTLEPARQVGELAELAANALVLLGGVVHAQVVAHVRVESARVAAMHLLDNASLVRIERGRARLEHDDHHEHVDHLLVAQRLQRAEQRGEARVRMIANHRLERRHPEAARVGRIGAAAAAAAAAAARRMRVGRARCGGRVGRLVLEHGLVELVVALCGDEHEQAHHAAFEQLDRGLVADGAYQIVAAHQLDEKNNAANGQLGVVDGHTRRVERGLHALALDQLSRLLVGVR